MKVILTEKITKLGNIGDTVEVKTGYARNYLLPNGKAMRFTRENVALFEAKKAELTARQEAAKKNAEANVDAVKNAKLHMIRQAGDTGQLYGSVSTRDIARMLKEVANVSVESAQVMLGSSVSAAGVSLQRQKPPPITISLGAAGLFSGTWGSKRKRHYTATQSPVKSKTKTKKTVKKTRTVTKGENTLWQARLLSLAPAA